MGNSFHALIDASFDEVIGFDEYSDDSRTELFTPVESYEGLQDVHAWIGETGNSAVGMGSFRHKYLRTLFLRH